MKACTCQPKCADCGPTLPATETFQPYALDPNWIELRCTECGGSRAPWDEDEIDPHALCACGCEVGAHVNEVGHCRACGCEDVCLSPQRN